MFAKSEPMPLALRGVDLSAVIMIGAAVNALVVSVVDGLASGTASLTLGISPFQLLAVLVAARLSIDGGRADARGLGWLEAVVLALILVPSSAVSWGALAIYAGVQALSSTGPRRTGALIFLGAALASVWSSVALKWISLPVTSAEAFVLAKMLALVRPDIVQFGNVVGNPEAHNLILMTRCTSADALPHAAVALAAVAYLLGEVDLKKLARAVIILAVVYAAGNMLRLAGMAWSGEAYALIHGPIGANAFDLFQAFLVLGLGNWASTP